MYLLKSFTPLVPWSKHFFWTCCFHKECQNLNSFTYNESILCPLLPHRKVASHRHTRVVFVGGCKAAPASCLYRVIYYLQPQALPSSGHDVRYHVVIQLITEMLLLNSWEDLQVQEDVLFTSEIWMIIVCLFFFWPMRNYCCKLTLMKCRFFNLWKFELK